MTSRPSRRPGPRTYPEKITTSLTLKAMIVFHRPPSAASLKALPEGFWMENGLIFCLTRNIAKVIQREYLSVY